MTSLVRSRWAAIGAAVAVTLGAGSLISVNASGSTSSLVPITPERILDTRSADRVGSLDTAGASDPYRLKVTGTADIPATGVTGVSLNVTAVDTQTNDFGGFVSVYPCASVSTTKPDVSNMNFGSGQTIANAVTVPVSADGHICLYVYGTAHLLVDANGYYAQASTAVGQQGPQGERGPAGPVSHNCIATLRWDLNQCNDAIIDVGNAPEAAASDGTNIYVTNLIDGTVSVIDPATNTETTTVPVGGAPDGIAFDGTNIYVTNYTDDTVSIINPDTNTVTNTISVGDGPSGVIFDGTNIYVTNYLDDTVTKFLPQ
ncbi:MAG: YncE family protein [Ilumatobacteraceae bacterium]